MLNRIWARIKEAYYRRPLPYTLLVVFCCSLFVYHQYIIYNTPYLFSISDGVDQITPYMVGLADYIREYGGLPSWSFNIGLGAPFPIIHISNLFLLIPTLLAVVFGNDFIASSAVYFQIIKILLASLFFFSFLRKLDFKTASCSIVTLLLAFSGIMITRGYWVGYATECVLMAFLLYALECYFKDNKWTLIPIAVFLICITLGPYYLYLYSILILFYISIRFIHKNKFKVRDYLIFISKLFVLCLIGVLIACVFLIPFVYDTLSSSRFSEVASNRDAQTILTNIFSLSDAKVYLSEVYRTFSADIIGAFNTSTVHVNYLEGPLFYCGLVSLLMIPQSIAFSRGKTRGVLIFGLVAAIIYLVFPYVNQILSGLIRTELHFKLSSLWICIYMLLATAYSMNKIFSGESVHKKLLVITTIVLLTVLFGLMPLGQQNGLEFNSNIVLLVAVLLGAFCVLFLSRKRQDKDCFSQNRSIFFTVALFVMVLIELNAFAVITTEQAFLVAETTTKQKYQSINNREDTFGDAVATIKAIDDSVFYRINKTSNLDWCYPIYYNYYSSSNYNSYVPPSYIDYLNKLNVEMSRSGTTRNSYSGGVYERPLQQILLGYKYQISAISNDSASLFYTPIESNSEYSISQAKDVLPLGFTYDKYIFEENFMGLNTAEKDIAMLDAMVIPDSSQIDTQQIASVDVSALQQVYASNYIDAGNKVGYASDSVLSENIVSLTSASPGFFELYATSSDPYFFFNLENLSLETLYQVDFEVTTHLGDEFVEVYWESKKHGFDAAYCQRYTLSESQKQEGTARVSFVIVGEAINRLRIDPGTTIDYYKVSNLSIKSFDDVIQMSAIRDRLKAPFVIESFRQSTVSGTVKLDEQKLLFLSIPYAAGWSATLDGQSVGIHRVNIGFIGIEVPAGDHQLELNYIRPGSRQGIVISSIGVGIFIAALLIDKKRKSKKST